MAVKGLVTSLRLEQSSSAPLGAVGFSFNGAEVAPDQPGLLAWPRGRLLHVGFLRDPQSLKLKLDVLSRAALFQRLVEVLVVITQNVAFFDETVWKLRQALRRVSLRHGALAILPVLSDWAAAALGATAQATLIRVQ